MEKTLGEKLRDLRETYDLTQKQVADSLNVDRSTYTNYELDKTRPTLEALVKLSRIFSIPKDALLPDEEEDPVRFKMILKKTEMIRSLTKEERSLVTMYRSFDSDEKRDLVEYMSNIAKNQK